MLLVESILAPMLIGQAVVLVWDMTLMSINTSKLFIFKEVVQQDREEESDVKP